jgi:hypothetical protein
VEGVHGLALDLDLPIARVLGDHDPPVILQLLLGLARKLHEFPAHAIAYRWQFHARTARVAVKANLIDVVALDDGIDHQPALGISRADEPGAEQIADPTRAAVAANDEFSPQRARALAGFDRQHGLVTTLHQIGDGVPEQHPDIVEPRQTPEQNPLELRLVEGSQRRVAVRPAGRKVRLHQHAAARIEMTDVGVLDQSRLDVAEQPNL